MDKELAQFREMVRARSRESAVRESNIIYFHIHVLATVSHFHIYSTMIIYLLR